MRALIICLLIMQFQAMQAQDPEHILLKDYRPVSVYRIPNTEVDKPIYQVFDSHSHPYANSPAEIDTWVETMDYFGIEKTIILTGATGAVFDSLVEAYGKYPGHFDLWCGIDFSGSDQEGWSVRAIKELERCKKMGAKGVGEITDKGLGLYSSVYSSSKGLRLNGVEMVPVLEKMAELGMPINIHMAEPIWMYEKMDNTNDGLMNGWTWRINKEAAGIVLHDGLMQQFEDAVSKHPNTTFVACHFLNCSYDLAILGKILDSNQNVFADISARYAETAPIPRYMRSFYEKYQDRLLYGTDMGFDRDMYRVTFHILETADEHFYETGQFGYHWPLNGFDLPEDILKKLYFENAKQLFK